MVAVSFSQSVRQVFADVLAEKPYRPNIVLILADDLGWSDTSVYGADLADTPNLARLAKSGVRFTNAYSAAPVCSPTRHRTAERCCG